MKYHVIALLSFIALSACNNAENNVITQQPKVSAYSPGEKWIWKYKGITTSGEVRSEGTDTRVIIENNGELAITIGEDTIPVAEIVKPDESKTPKYDWPLKVGKTWKYENNWTSQDGTTGKQSQDAKILSFKEETVEAGTFMAYTIQYKGEITNSRGYSASVDEIWIYAPKVKNFIKLTQKQDDFTYQEELIEYTKPK